MVARMVLPRAVFLSGLTAYLLALVGCGSHSPTLPGAGAGLAGIVDYGDAEFVVGAGETVFVAGDVIIRAQSARIEGDLVARQTPGSGADGYSITIETPDGIAVTGRIMAGDGTAGGQDGAGGNGGSVILASANGDIIVGVGDSAGDGSAAGGAAVHAGDGADGGGGTLGGGGGGGGSIALNCPNGTLTINQSPGLFHVGDGGGGGDGVVGGQALLVTSPAEELSNGGGDSGWLNADCQAVAGVDVHDRTTDEGQAIKAVVFDEGVATGGIGGAAGHYYYGIDPVTGQPTWPDTPAQVVERPANGEDSQPWVTGDSGGNGWATGGSGASVWVSHSDEEMGPGQPGADALGEGGTGGTAGTSRWAHGFSLFKSWSVTGGDGGNVDCYAGNGGTASDCSPGGPGGDAHAIGGTGGQAFTGLRLKLRKSGDGGEAKARGGNGGDAGDCCNPPRHGRTGGAAGDALAYGGYGGWRMFPLTRDRGGDAWARGGNGGNGGDGYVPGDGGPRGTAFAKGGQGTPMGSADATQGAPGNPGATCPNAPPPPDNTPEDIVGRLLTTEFLEWTVKLFPRVPQTNSDSAQASGTIVDTDENGYFLFKDVPPGDYELFPAPDEAAPPDYWDPAIRRITKVAGVALTDQDFEKRTGAKHTVAVVVRDQNADPMPGVPVNISGYALVRGRHDGTTGADGKATFPDLWSGLYYVAVMELAPSGFRWEPEQASLMVRDNDVETEIRLVPE